jgi:hypothetical protein
MPSRRGAAKAVVIAGLVLTVGAVAVLGSVLAGQWVPKTYATRRYSWMTPPARS